MPNRVEYNIVACFIQKFLNVSRVARESVLHWQMAFKHDSRKIERRNDKAKYAKEREKHTKTGSGFKRRRKTSILISKYSKFLNYF